MALAFRAHNQVAVFCSGSLLAPNLVLTARHCIAQIGDGSSEEVHCGTSHFQAKYDPRQIYVSTDSQPESGGQLYAVKEIREAPGSTEVCGYDVALLILTGNGIPASVASPIEPVLDTPTKPKNTFAAVGYGLTRADDKDGVTSGKRMRFDSSSVFCVGTGCPADADTAEDEWVGNSPVCSGDSGGPALDAQGRVFGVTSRGDTDCTYALYSNVADWAGFIRGTAQDAADFGGYAPLAWANEPTAPVDSTPGSAGATAEPTAPSVDPLGASCSGGECPGSYQCFSASGTPPGICVPPCNAAGDACPDRYACDTTNKVCRPTQPTVTKTRVSASCALGAPLAHGGGAALALGLVGLAWLGRRRRGRA